MAHVKFTKVELLGLNNRWKLFQKYLPTLQLKKMLLQTEVNKAKEEVVQNENKYNQEKAVAKDHAKLITDPQIEGILKNVSIQEIKLTYDNIAGIDIPKLDEVIFEPLDYSLMDTPVWTDHLIEVIYTLIRAYQTLLVSIKKREVLEKELRSVSIRVNLFEKRLIPELEKDIGRIRVFLGDQELQAVSQAKVSKNKILEKKREMA